jgi:hypothetical protein
MNGAGPARCVGVHPWGNAAVYSRYGERLRRAEERLQSLNRSPVMLVGSYLQKMN